MVGDSESRRVIELSGKEKTDKVCPVEITGVFEEIDKKGGLSEDFQNR